MGGIYTRAGDLLLDNFGKIMTSFLLFIFLMMYIIAEQRNATRDVFMAECTQDHKEYDCSVAWQNQELL
jgi:hypothetical protein